MTTITERWLIRAVTGNIAEQGRDEPGSRSSAVRWTAGPQEKPRRRQRGVDDDGRRFTKFWEPVTH